MSVHFLESIFLNAGTGGILLALWFVFLSWQCWRNLMTGVNGPTKAMMLFFAALAIEHISIAAAFISLVNHLAETAHPGYINYARVGVAGAMLLLGLSLLYLHLESRNVQDD